MLTPERLKKIIDADTTRQKKAEKQLAYVHGEHPGILEPAEKEEPDNRIPVPFARRAVEMVCGYLAKPGNIVYAGPGYDQALKDTFAANDETLETAELLRTACTNGKSYELHWTTKGKGEFKQVPYLQCVPVYDGNLKPKMTEFIRYWTDEEGKGQADVYDAVSRQHFTKEKGEQPWKLYGPPELHGYKRVPVVAYRIDPDSLNLFDHVIALIDAFDKIISENYANDLQSLSSAILLLAGKLNTNPDDSIDGVSDAEKVVGKRLKYLDGLIQDGTGSVADKVAFLTKQVDPAFPGGAAAIIERLIYEMLQLFNPNDETFNSPSGVAAQYKLIGFEYLCTKITQYFTLGLQDRIALIKGLNNTLTGEAQNTQVEIDWKRNLPNDIKMLADIAVALDGILSQETILNLFPSYIIADVKKEIARLKKEKEERMKDAPKLYPAGQPGQNQEEEEE